MHAKLNDVPNKLYRILAVASEWFSFHGGLSTFNRSLCAALASAGHEVTCLLPEASIEEIEDAESVKVALVKAPASIGLSAEARMCLPVPTLTDPEIIIGHGHITGPIAAARRTTFYPNARYVHFLHTIPEELEWYKTRNQDVAERADGKQDTEARLSISSSLAVAVGPRLARLWSNHMTGLKKGVLIHRLNPGLAVARVVEHPPPGIECLVLGRIEDLQIKGVDIAASALGAIAARGSLRGALEPTLVIRGAGRGTTEELRRQLTACAKTGILIRIKEYTHDIERLREDIARASVVLMPSRVEGFGLVGLEAISMGVPVLISKRSGLGELLLERVKVDSSLAFAAKYVVDVQDQADIDTERWANAIQVVLTDRETVFTETAALRDALLETAYWPRAVSELLHALDKSTESIPGGEDVDQFRLAEEFADSDPAVSVAMSTSLLEQSVEKAVVSRGIAKAGLLPEQYSSLLASKGLLTSDDAKWVNELYRRRNMAVHGANLRIDSEAAADHARSVRSLITHLPPIVDETSSTVVTSAKRLNRFISLMGWKFGDEESDATVALVGELVGRLRQVPKRTRQLLVSIVQRSSKAAGLSHCATVLLAEIQTACNLESQDLADQLRILDRYGIARYDLSGEDYSQEICLRTLEGPWDFWNDLKYYCRATGNSLEDFIIDLRFDLLD